MHTDQPTAHSGTLVRYKEILSLLWGINSHVSAQCWQLETNTHAHTDTGESWQVAVVKCMHAHRHTCGYRTKALQTSVLLQQPDLTSWVNLSCIASRPPGRMFAGAEASGEPGQMNDAELQDGDLISGLFSVPLWVNRLQDAARVRLQRKLKVKVTCPRHYQ